MDLKDEVISKACLIAYALKQGKDVEIRKTKDGITVAAIGRKVLREIPDGWDTVSK